MKVIFSTFVLYNPSGRNFFLLIKGVFMKRKTVFFNNHRAIIKPSFFTALCLLCALGVICYPAASFQAAQRGLQTWWEIVVPSLLPFFIIAELLMNLGFVAFLGTLMNPAMRPLFNLPGSSGFILAVSYLSGFHSVLFSAINFAGRISAQKMKESGSLHSPVMPAHYLC
jgi:hypothetical protein